MSGPIFNRTGDSVREAPSSPFIDGRKLMQEDYNKLWKIDQERTQRILANRQAAVLENKTVLYILNLESTFESFEEELTKLHINVRLWKEHRQKLVNKNSLLRICLQHEVKKLMSDRVMNMQMVEEIQRLRIYLNGASGMRSTANSRGFSRMLPRQDLIVNSEASPSASDSEVRSQNLDQLF